MTGTRDYYQAPNKFIKSNSGETFAYREMGVKQGIPVVLFTHLSATLDNWDPEMMNELAKKNWLVAFDNLGVGLSSGQTPTSIEKMAADGLQFIDSLGFKEVDILGLSMGGMVAQELIMKRPQLVRKLMLVGTGPRGGHGIADVSSLTNKTLLKSLLTFKDIKTYLFFTATENGQAKGKAFLTRLKARKDVKDKNIALGSYRRQLKALDKWGAAPAGDLSKYTQPTLVVNGDQDIMVPTINSYDLAERLPNADIHIYEDAGHGSLFQFPMEFAKLATNFLSNSSDE